MGTFKDEYETEVELILKSPSQMYINGMVVAGSSYSIGVLDNFVLGYNNGVLVYTDDDYKLLVTILDENTIQIEETNPIHGVGAGFNGTYKKVK